MIDFKRLWADGICNKCRGYGEDTMPENFPKYFMYALENHLLLGDDRNIQITIAYYDESHPTYRQVSEQYELTLERVRQICIKTCRIWRNQRQLLVNGIIEVKRIPINYRPKTNTLFTRTMSLFDDLIEVDTRTRNILIRAGISTLGDLVDISEEELVDKLQHRYGAGKKSIETAKQLRVNYLNIICD